MSGEAVATAPALAARPIVFAVRDLPIEVFGGEHGRQTRKFVLLMLATHADSDGTRCFPSLATIARECGLTSRGTRKVVSWLRDNGFLEIAYRKGPSQSNMFTVLIPEVRNSSVPQELQRSSGTETTGVRNSSVPGGTERRAQGTELQRSSNLPRTYQSPTRKAPTKARKSTALVFVPPEWVPKKEWKDFVQMRIENRKPLTLTAAKQAVTELDKLRSSGNEPAAVLSQSVLSCWAGLFPLKGGNGKRPAQRLSEIDYHASSGLPEGTNVGTF